MQESCLARNLLLSSMPHLRWFPSLSQLWNSCRWCPSQNTAHRYTNCFQKTFPPLCWAFYAVHYSSLLLYRSSSCGTARSHPLTGASGRPCQCLLLSQMAKGKWVSQHESTVKLRPYAKNNRPFSQAHSMTCSAFYRQAVVSCRIPRLRRKQCSALMKTQCYWLVRLDLPFHD